MNDYILFKNLEGKYLTLKDCLEENKEKHENTIFYVTDEKEQSQYINMFKAEGLDAVIPVSYTHLFPWQRQDVRNMKK